MNFTLSLKATNHFNPSSKYMSYSHFNQTLYSPLRDLEPASTDQRLWGESKQAELFQGQGTSRNRLGQVWPGKISKQHPQDFQDSCAKLSKKIQYSPTQPRTRWQEITQFIVLPSMTTRLPGFFQQTARVRLG